MQSHENISIESLEKKIYDQKQLIEISKALSSTLDYKYLIDAILNICLAQLQTLHAAIFLAPDVESDYLVLDRGFKGFEFSESEMKQKISLASSVVGVLEKTPKACSIADLQKTKGLARSRELAFLTKANVEVIVPLTAKGKVNGLLLLGEKMTLTEFPDDELDFLTSLAGIAGIAVENTRLYELATNDIMTGVKVYHFFKSRLKEEIQRSRKKNQKLSLIFADVDKFKNFNDTYGHQTGDLVLREVAGSLLEKSRKNDIVARYGGEEFCIILPSTGEEEAREIAERIRIFIEKKTVTPEKKGEKLRVTISMGVTELKKSDKSGQDLIKRADKALYQAKKEGRNRTVCY